MLEGDHKPGAVIAGGHFASLAVARNLGRYGISVFIVDSENCLSRYSKFSKRFFLCPPEKEEGRLIDFLINLSLTHPDITGSALFVSRDEQVRIFSQNREELSEHYIVSVPEWEVTKYLYDKRLTSKLAIQQQVPIPETITTRSIQDVLALDPSYPLVIKPAVTPDFVSKTKKKAYRANNPQELISLYNQIAEILNPEEILIQEFIPGGSKNLYSYFGYFRDGYPVVGYAAKRLRQHPTDFGRSSTFVISAYIPELENLAIQLLTGIGYTGLAEVEFMFDPNHSRYELLEVNPRIWGWLSLSIHAGIDIPYIAYAEMIAKPYTFGGFTEGRKWIHFATDFPTALSELIHGRLTFQEYFWSISGSQDAVFSINDPLPFLIELCLIPHIVKQRGF